MPEKEDLSLYIKNDSDDISSSKLLFEISIFDDNQFDFPPKSQNQPKMVEWGACFDKIIPPKMQVVQIRICTKKQAICLDNDGQNLI